MRPRCDERHERRKPQEIAAEARRRSLEQMAKAGAALRESRVRRRLTQAGLGQLVGRSRMFVCRAETGRGGRITPDEWMRLAVALGRRLDFAFAADPLEEPLDAGHLDIQELVLRCARPVGYERFVELPSRPARPGMATDVCLRHRTHRVLALVECMNRTGDIGGSLRSFDRKLAEVAEAAVAVGGEDPYRVAGCWVVRDTAHNRALLSRYPEIFTTRFPGSSSGWVSALTTGSPPPREPGLVWSDTRSTRLFAWRRPGG